MIEEFGFQHGGHSFRVTLSGGATSKEGPPRRPTVEWNVQRDDGEVFTVHSEPGDTEEGIRARAIELAEELEG